MKPLLIRMKNVGPYLDETIDFTKLDNLFLIKGATGAGKTYIFDAMTYALYGSLAGNRSKNGVKIKNRDVPEEETEVFVEFTFMCGDETYRVKRNVPDSNLTFERKLKDGSEKFESLKQKNKTEAAKFIKSIIGLELGEFSQVVVLPQGQFSEFLHESSNDRNKTLQKIFPVADYEKLIEIVAKRYEKQFEGVDSLQKVLDSEQKDTDYTDAENKIREMQNQLENAEKNKSGLNNEILELTKKQAELNNKYSAALKYEENLQKLADLDKNKAEIDELEKKVKLADSAVSLKTYLDSKNAAAVNVKNAQDLLSELKNKLNQINEDFVALDNKKSQMEKLPDIITEQQIELSRLNDSLEAAKNLPELKNKMDEAKKAVDDADKELGEIRREIAEKSEVLKGKKVSVLIEEATSEITGFMESVADIEKLVEAAKKKSGLEADKTKKLEEIETNENLKKTSMKKLDEAKKNVDEISKAISDFKDKNSAFTLSLLLKPNCPCPVCGSKEHPLPAVKPDGTFDLEQMNKLLAEKQTDLEIIQAAVNNCENNISGANSAIQGIDDQLSEINGMKGLDKTEILEAKLAAEKESKAAKESEKTNLVNLQTELEDLSSRENSASDALSETAKTYEAAKAVYENAAKELKNSEEEIQAQYDKVNKTFTENKDAYENWKREYDRISGEKLSKETEINSCNENISALENTSETALHLFNEKLGESDFENEELLCEAIMEPEKLESSRETVQSYREDYRSASDIVKNAEVKEKSEKIKEDLEECSKEIDNRNSALNELEKDIKNLNSEKSVFSTGWEKVKSHTEQLKVLKKEIAPLEKLYKDISGYNNPKIRYDSWALGMYFEEILLYASDRFSSLTNNRYSFQLKDTDEPAKGNRFNGLDLLVRDNTNGKVFDAAELSGGETFEASISLALAITDVVKNNSGGANLESLFIDEGFGTLDPDTLEKAMRLFQELGENKMVGVISHVEGLETEIPSYLEIEKGLLGSRATIGNMNLSTRVS